MPEISRFYGIIIAMFHDEHNPPHFHARYGSDKISIRIPDLSILGGSLPPRALGIRAIPNREIKESILKITTNATRHDG